MLNAWDLYEMVREARWDGLVLLGRAFLDAAGAKPWMWGIAALILLTASRKKLMRLARYIGGTAWHHYS